MTPRIVCTHCGHQYELTDDINQAIARHLEQCPDRPEDAA